MPAANTLAVDAFEAAWQRTPPGGEPPRWADFLPDDTAACPPDLLVFLLETDIERRVKSGRAAILAERYWEHPRLAGVLDVPRRVELVRRELSLRRAAEPGCSHREYATTFPDLAASFKGLTMAKPNDPSTLSPPSGMEPAALPSDVNATHETTDTVNPEIEDDSALLAPSQTPGEIGRLAHYRILRRLGAGGMGVVYEAEDTHLARPVALKVMRSAAAKSPTGKDRFLREARASAAVRHDHIVTIYQVGEDRGCPFIALEFLHGQPLDRWLKENPKPAMADILRIGREVALGLAAAHAKGLVHRDIKPANIWLEAETNRVKILDFGLARAAAADHELTKEGMVVGTPAYMAPEQAADQSCDGRTDLFSLGVLLYRLCTGRLPFHGTTTMALLRSLAVDDPAAITPQNPAVPAALADLIMTLLNKAPEGRPASATAVAKALAEIPAREPAASREGSASVAERSSPRKTRTPQVVGIGLAFLVVVSVITWQVMVRVKNPGGSETVVQVPPKATVTLEQGGKEVAVVPATNSAQKSLPRSDEPDYSLERDAAVKLNTCFELDVRLKSGRLFSVQPNRKLPDEPFVVTAIKSTHWVVDKLPDDLQRGGLTATLFTLKCVRLLHVEFYNISPTLAGADLRKLAKAPLAKTCEVLWLSNVSFDDDAVIALEGFTALTDLKIDVNNCTDSQISGIARLPQLKRLFLSLVNAARSTSAENTNHAISSLTEMKLTSLRFNATGAFGSAWGLRLGAVKTVQELYIGSLTDDMIASISHLPDLKSLMMDNKPRVTDLSVEKIASIENLQEVNFGEAPITEAGLRRLRDLKPQLTIKHATLTVPPMAN